MKKIIKLLIPIAFILTNIYSQREFYELRKYEVKWGSSQKILSDYLENSFLPTLNRYEVKNIGVFTQIGNNLPKNIYVLIPYESFEQYNQIYFKLKNDEVYSKSSSKLNSVENDKMPYTRYSVSHFYAFKDFPKIRKPGKGMSIFEIRNYESPNDEAYLKKVDMFNNGEIDIFDEVGLNSVFYGEKISGEKLPLLTYMLVYDSMDSRSKSWTEFIKHPKWIEMKSMKKYMTISDESLVSNITSIFLKPLKYSQL